MRTLHTAAAVLTAGVLVAGLAACGGTGPTTAGAKPAATAAAENTDAFPREFTPAEFMDHIIDAQFEAGSLSMSMQMTGATEVAMDSAMVFDNGDGELGLVVTVGEGEQRSQVYLVGGQFYLNAASIMGDKFVQIDPDDETNPLHAAVAGVAESDPRQQSEDVRDAATSVELVGEEDVDGTPAAHYTVVIDPAKVTGQTAAGFELSGLEMDEIVYEYWIDEQGRPLRMTYDIDFGGQTMGSTITMSEWGEVAPIVAPGPEQITTLEELGLA